MPERTDDDVSLRHRAVMKYTSDVLLMIDRDGFIVETNERTADLFPERPVGYSIQDIFKGSGLSMSQLKNKEIVQTVRVNCHTKSDSHHPFLLTFVPLVRDGAVGEVVVIGRDMREKDLLGETIDRLEQDLSRLERERDDLLDRVSSGNGEESLAETLRGLEAANLKLEDMNGRFRRELEMASTLQHSLVPHNLREHPDLRLAFHFKPMAMVGGDYFDVVDLDEGKRGIFIADVSGHGISSAFIAAMLKISFLNYSYKYRSPAAVLDKLNREYCRVIQTGEYLTAFYGILNPKAGKLTYCGAGHPDSMLLRTGEHDVTCLPSEGFFIGMFEGAAYGDRSVEFTEGDKLLLYTDGVIEAYSDERHEQFGLERLQASFRGVRKRSVPGIVNGIVEDVEEFMGESTFHDDLALICAEYRRKRRQR